MEQLKIIHIIIACSNAGELAVLQEFSDQVHPSVTIAVAASGEALDALVRQKIPDLIIVLRLKNDAAQNHHFIDVIRKNERLDDIPVFVYTATPEKKDLLDLLKKWRNALSYLPL